MKLFWLDVETTGTKTDEHEIVQISAICNGEEFNAYIIPSEQCKVSAMALIVNGRKLGRYPAESMTAQDAAEKLFDFMARHREGMWRYDRFTLAGHNVSFDRDFLDAFYAKLNVSGILDLFDHHPIDTMTLAKILIHSELLPPKQKLALEDLCQTMDIKIEKAHDSLSDIRATKQLYEKIIARLKS